MPYWEMHEQKMVADRLYHRSIQTGRHVLHFGGKQLIEYNAFYIICSGFDQDYQEAWELQPDGNFAMTTADYITDEWKYYPYIFNVGKNDF